MIRFTYKYISIAIILLFICTSLLSAISANEHVWYAYIIPCILSGVILVKRAKKIDFDKDRLSVWGLYKTDIFYLKDVRKFELFKDAFFLWEDFRNQCLPEKWGYEKILYRNIGCIIHARAEEPAE